MRHETYLAPSCEITELEPQDSVLLGGSNESYHVTRTNPFGDYDYEEDD